MPSPPLLWPPHISRNPPTMHPHTERPSTHADRVFQNLRRLGVSWWGMTSMTARELPRVIHPHEHIGGVVYGRSNGGFVMLVATDRRVVFLEKRLLYVNEDEINYYVVSGVSISHAGPGSTVTLHTRIKDFTIRTFNTRCAENFIRYIESRCLEQVNANGGRYDQFAQKRYL